MPACPNPKSSRAKREENFHYLLKAPCVHIHCLGATPVNGVLNDALTVYVGKFGMSTDAWVIGHVYSPRLILPPARSALEFLPVSLPTVHYSICTYVVRRRK